MYIIVNIGRFLLHFFDGDLIFAILAAIIAVGGLLLTIAQIVCIYRGCKMMFSGRAMVKDNKRVLMLAYAIIMVICAPYFLDSTWVNMDIAILLALLFLVSI